ncbi:MAG: DMT family transporter [candidate division Zixibacteria bacterium]|nr:DMT family transporter [candidate division Zixibacteria bacterium]
MIAARLMLFACVIFWGWSFVATKIALDYVTPVEVMALRYLFGLPVLFLILLSKKIKFKIEKRDYKGIILGAIIITVHFLIQITGLKYTSATNTGWIISVTPLVMAVLAFFILKEKIVVKQIAGIVIATIGIMLMVSKGDLTDLSWLGSVGDWLVLASAHTWAFYTIATRDVSRRGSPLLVSIAVLTPSAIVIFIYVLFTSDLSKFVVLPLEPLLALMFLGVFALGLAHWFWQEGIAAGCSPCRVFLVLRAIGHDCPGCAVFGGAFWAVFCHRRWSCVGRGFCGREEASHPGDRILRGR